MKEKVNYLFTEKWEKEAIRFACEKGYSLENYDPKAQKIWVTDATSYLNASGRMEPVPIFLMEWAEQHPLPKYSMMELVYQLGLRVEKLETIIAEKGGAL